MIRSARSLFLVSAALLSCGPADLTTTSATPASTAGGGGAGGMSMGPLAQTEPATCGGLAASSAECGACASTSCCDPGNACGASPDCVAAVRCLERCTLAKSAGRVCSSGCLTSHPTGAAELASLLSCLGQSCAASCDAAGPLARVKTSAADPGCGGPAPCAASCGDCDGSPLNGCELDVSVATSNCGSCGNVCPATFNCVQGFCTDPNQVTLPDGTLAVGLSNASRIVVGGGFVYIGEHAGSELVVRRVPVTPGTAPSAVATCGNEGTGIDLAADGAFVYVACADSVLRVPHSGGASETLYQAASGARTMAVTVDAAGHVYTLELNANEVHVIDVTTPAAPVPVTTTVAAKDGNGVLAVGPDGTMYIIADNFTLAPPPYPSTPTQAMVFLTQMRQLFVDGGELFYSSTSFNGKGAGTGFASLDGATRTAYTQTNVSRIAVDATNVYFVSATGSQGQILFMPRAGGAPTALVPSVPATPVDMVTANGTLYWLMVNELRYTPLP